MFDFGSGGNFPANLDSNMDRSHNNAPTTRSPPD
jgi:hypothetical protein